MLFKSSPLKAVTYKRKMIKFDSNGEYTTKDKDEIKALSGASDITEVKKEKSK